MIFLFLVIILFLSVASTVSARPTQTYEGISSRDKCNEGAWTTSIGAPDVAKTRPEYALVNPGVPERNITGTVVEAHVSHEDAPWTHTSHDVVWFVKLDPPFQNLNSLDNRPYQSKKVTDKVMEMEWEIGTANDGRTDRFPEEFWPSTGDRVWMIGRYIFDCGHPPPRTELHPASAVAFTRFEPLILGSPGSEPIFAAKTSIYIHGEGGPIYQTPVGGRSYDFNVNLPPKPSPTSKLLMQVMNTPFGGPAPILTGPFSGPGPSDNYMHVKYDLTSVKPSPKNRFGAHIAAGWVDPPQNNVYHYLTVSFNSVAKNPSISARLARDHVWDQLWANVNGQYVELLNTSIGFKKHSDPNKRILSPAPSVNTIVAEQGLESMLNISTTGWLMSTDHNDPCFGTFDTIDLSTTLDLLRAAHCADSDTEAESLGKVDKEFPLVYRQTGPRKDVCSDPNPEVKVQIGSSKVPTKCEFMIDFDIKDGGSIVVANPSTRPPITPSPLPTPTPAPTPTPVPNPSPTPTPNPSPAPEQNACDSNSRTIKKNSTGAKVTELQRYLTQLGYGKLLGKHGPNLDGIDGKFGDDTRKAVIKFQQDKHLKKIDGIVGPETWGALCSSLSSVSPTGLIKGTNNNFHQIAFMAPKVTVIENLPSFYHLVTLEQDSTINSPSNLSLESEEFEYDFPAGNYEVLANLSETELSQLASNALTPPPDNTTLSLSAQPPSNEITLPDNTTLRETEPPSEGLICPDGNTPDPSTSLCSDGSQPRAFNATAFPTEQQQPLICADGNIPAPTTGLCTDGSQPQPSAPAVTQPLGEQQQFFCADGSAPDPSTGLCADGTQPQSFNAIAAAPPLAEQQLICADGNIPAPTTGLCTDGSQPQPSAPAVTQPLGEQQQFFCADGSASDPSTGLCADGTQPQPATPAATPPSETEQLMCADGTAPDVITGLCSDGSQPQSATPITTAPSETEQLICADGNIPDPSTGLCFDGSQPQPAALTAPPFESEQQFICADGTAPDVTTGLCPDGSQPQSAAPTTTTPSETERLLCAGGSLPDSTTGLCADGSQP